MEKKKKLNSFSRLLKTSAIWPQPNVQLISTTLSLNQIN